MGDKMVKATMDIRLKAVLLSLEKIKTTNEICTLFSISGVPLLMVRRMHKEDHVFMKLPSEIEAYNKYFR